MREGKHFHFLFASVSYIIVINAMSNFQNKLVISEIVSCKHMPFVIHGQYCVY